MSAIQIFNLLQVVQITTGPALGTNLLNYPLNRTDFKLYRNITNVITVLIRDIDRQNVTFASGTIPIVTIIDKFENKIIYSGVLTLIDPAQSMWTFTVGPNDLQECEVDTCTYIVTTQDSSGNVSALFMNRGYSVEGMVEIINGPFPSGTSSKVISTFLSQNQTLYSTPLPGAAQVGNVSGLSTIAVYGTNFTGNVLVQGMLDTAYSDDNTQWLSIDTLNLTNLNGITYFNFTGNYYWIRFVISGPSVMIPQQSGSLPNTQFISQILYRA